jgi:hypothetical protein
LSVSVHPFEWGQRLQGAFGVSQVHYYAPQKIHPELYGTVQGVIGSVGAMPFVSASA